MTIDKNTLQALFNGAKPGDSLTLAAGAYPPSYVKGKTFAPPVTVTAAPGAISQGIVFQLCSGITLKGWEITADPLQGAGIKGGCANLTLDTCNLHGAAVGDGGGASLINSPGARIVNCEIHHLSGGLGLTHCDNSLVDGNSFHDLQRDGIDVNASSHVTVSNNRFTDFYPQPGDHSDAIQFLTTGQTAPATDLVVTGNTYLRGKGSAATQGIFFGNEAKIAYQRVTITGNAIVGAIYQGLMLSMVDVCTVSDNFVVGYSDINSWINVNQATTATVSNNVSSTFNLGVGTPGLVAGGNVTVPLAAVGDLTGFTAWTHRHDPMTPQARLDAIRAAISASPADPVSKAVLAILTAA